MAATAASVQFVPPFVSSLVLWLPVCNISRWFWPTKQLQLWRPTQRIYLGGHANAQYCSLFKINTVDGSRDQELHFTTNPSDMTRYLWVLSSPAFGPAQTFPSRSCPSFEGPPCDNCSHFPNNFLPNMRKVVLVNGRRRQMRGNRKEGTKKR